MAHVWYANSPLTHKKLLEKKVDILDLEEGCEYLLFEIRYSNPESPWLVRASIMYLEDIYDVEGPGAHFKFNGVTVGISGPSRGNKYSCTYTENDYEDAWICIKAV